MYAVHAGHAGHDCWASKLIWTFLVSHLRTSTIHVRDVQVPVIRIVWLIEGVGIAQFLLLDYLLNNVNFGNF